ncbi:MAG: hypothetical protein OEQ39_20250 [Gammaproteobacteria bacterium]|nr:hypothetical protein [Gammaproteobacteria bacterium]
MYTSADSRRPLKRQWVPGLLLYGILLLTVAVYWQGIHGPFLLDDKPNLNGLASISDRTDWDQVVQFLEGDGGHRGRYVSRLSFIPNALDWPARPQRFKHINIWLHALNGVILAWMLLLILRIFGDRPATIPTIVLSTTALWLLHPLNVSTVLYVVQRMTELSTLFTLAGLTGYLWGRRLATRRMAAGYAIMSVFVTLGTILATLSKENGILLAALVLVLEFTVLNRLPRPKHWRIWGAIFLSPPLIFLVGWHITHFEGFLHGYSNRDFSMVERLMTEWRVLLDYLVQIGIPSRTGTGLFHDDYRISHGLFDPSTTILSLVIILGLLAIALRARFKHPILSFAILWYFSSHLLESTLIPLEIYFEHRNYLPMIGPLLAAMYYLSGVPTRLKPIVPISTALLLAIVTFNTWSNTRIWARSVSLAETWEYEHPTSIRALQFAANAWIKFRRFDEVERRLRAVLNLDKDNSGARVQLVYVNCLKDGRLNESLYEDAIRRLPETRADSAANETLDRLIDLSIGSRCEGLEKLQLLALTDALMKAANKKPKAYTIAMLHLLSAKIYNISGDNRNAAHALAASFNKRPLARTAILESVSWAAIGEYTTALAAVDKAKRIYDRKLLNSARAVDDINRWKEQLLEQQYNASLNGAHP